MDNMLTNFLAKLLDLKRPETVEVDGLKYSTTNITPVKKPTPDHFKTTTLQSIVDYLKSKIDNPNGLNSFLHIEEPNKVSVLTKLEDGFLNRGSFLTALADNFKFKFGQYYSYEEFIIAMQSQFIMDKPCLELLEFTNTVSDVRDTTVSDDGVSQEVIMKAGIIRKEKAAIKNPIKLAPRRSFPEIEQVSTDFVLRIQNGPNGVAFALFEADGGQWRLEAMRRVKTWLDERLNQVTKADTEQLVKPDAPWIVIA